jgi:hypothetical protein
MAGRGSLGIRILVPPECCPYCHGRGQLRYVIAGGVARRVCCSVLAALINRGSEGIVILDRGLWKVGKDMARAVCGHRSDESDVFARNQEQGHAPQGRP